MSFLVSYGRILRSFSALIECWYMTQIGDGYKRVDYPTNVSKCTY